MTLAEQALCLARQFLHLKQLHENKYNPARSCFLYKDQCQAGSMFQTSITYLKLDLVPCTRVSVQHYKALNVRTTLCLESRDIAVCKQMKIENARSCVLYKDECQAVSKTKCLKHVQTSSILGLMPCTRVSVKQEMSPCPYYTMFGNSWVISISLQFSYKCKILARPLSLFYLTIIIVHPPFELVINSMQYCDNKSKVKSGISQSN